MLVELKEYAPMINICAGAVRKRIHKALLKGRTIQSVLPGVEEAKKYGKTWVFTIDEKKVTKTSK